MTTMFAETRLEEELRTPAPLGIASTARVDLRTTEGKRHKARLLAECIRLREEGITLSEISVALGPGTTTLSVWLLVAGRSDLTYQLKDTAPRSKFCKGCGGVLPESKNRGAPRKWCSDECRAANLGLSLRARREREHKEAEGERERRVEALRAKYRRCRHAGEAPPWHVKASAEPERDEFDTRLLASLLAEQEREMRREHSGWGERPRGTKSAQVGFAQSLDERFETENGGLSAELYEFAGMSLPSAEDEYLDLEYARELRHEVGDIGVEDVARLDEMTLGRLRDKLLDAGMARASIRHSERERLRTPQPKRGSAPPKRAERMSPKRKHRKPGHQASAGGSRSARKPRKPRDRWGREKVVW